MLITAQEFLDRSGRIEGAGALPLARVVRDTVAVIEAGQRDGSVRPGDPLAMTAALHGAPLHGVLGRPVYHRAAETIAGSVAEGSWEAEITRTALAGIIAGSED